MFDAEEEEQDVNEICERVLDEMGIRINEDVCITNINHFINQLFYY